MVRALWAVAKLVIILGVCDRSFFYVRKSAGNVELTYSEFVDFQGNSCRST
jgi:hypothetical protein